MSRQCAGIIMLVLSTPLVAGSQMLPGDEGVDRRIDSLLRMMTLEEKAGQLNQLPGQWHGGSRREGISDEEKDLVREGLVGSFLNITGAEAVREVQRLAVEESRLRIPLLFGLDVIHGFKTIFPIPLAEASSWDPAAVESSARVGAEEAAVSGINWTFAPMVDIARDPRWGRIAEGSGEEPYLGAVMAAARVRGFQGSTFKDSMTILACAKHYAAYGAAEAGRDYNTVDISERTLRDVYLPPFRAAVRAGVVTLMTSFNEIAGVPSTANRVLLTDILRTEWGFNGFVVSDWGAIEELQQHGIAGTPEDAAAKAIAAGVDMDMASRLFVTRLPALIRSGKVPIDLLDAAVRRVLRVKSALGLFEDPYRNCSPDLEKRIVLSPSHLEAARRMALESVVLLKNDRDILPISKNLKRLAVIGPLAVSKEDPLGPWHALGSPGNTVTVLEGLSAKVMPGTQVEYCKGCDSTFSDSSGFAEAASAARRADLAVLVLGETRQMSGEAASRADITLPGVQDMLARRIQETGTPVVLVLMNGRPLCIPWEAANVPSILETWFLGTQSGNAIADVLFGDINPGGKLPVTFPRSVGQIPLYLGHKNTGRPFSKDDSYTSKYLDIPNTPLFAFGEGRSYTTFAYSDLSIMTPRVHLNDTIRVSVRVTNTGKLRGDEVVQLYVRDDIASITRPVKELKGFQRISLDSGEGRTVAFRIAAADLGFHNEGMKYVVEPGTFAVYAGGNSVDDLEGKFEILAQ